MSDIRKLAEWTAKVLTEKEIQVNKFYGLGFKPWTADEILGRAGVTDKPEPAAGPERIKATVTTDYAGLVVAWFSRNGLLSAHAPGMTLSDWLAIERGRLRSWTIDGDEWDGVGDRRSRTYHISRPATIEPAKPAPCPITRIEEAASSLVTAANEMRKCQGCR